MKVITKQHNSRMCAICGLDNVYGVRAPFYSMEDGSVVTLFKYRPEHQSYPGRVHGGLITAMLDEMGLRALWAKEGNEHTYGVTISLDTKYRKPVPYDTDLVGRGEIVSDTSHFFVAHCTISLPQGKVLAEGDVRYMRLAVDKLGDNLSEHEEMCYLVDDGVREIDL